MPDDPLQKMSKEAVQQQLFDGLMMQINPGLTSKYQKVTARTLAMLSPDKRKEELEEIQQDYLKFWALWPEYVAMCTQGAGKFAQGVTQEIQQKDQTHMESLESQIDSLPSAT
ncbi:MAG: hypothetical protein WCX61_03445 [Candidatus Peribacteraceae bacterium]